MTDRACKYASRSGFFIQAEMERVSMHLKGLGVMTGQQHGALAASGQLKGCKELSQRYTYTTPPDSDGQCLLKGCSALHEFWDYYKLRISHAWFYLQSLVQLVDCNGSYVPL